MKISYIAPVTVSSVMATQQVGTLDVLMELLKGNPELLENAISNAINKSIVIPFVTACTKGWLILVEVSGIITLFVAMAGVISYIAGVKKGKDVAITCGVIHLIIQLLNYFIMRC